MRIVSVLALALLAAPVRADEPRPIPLTRPEMKQLLEDMKGRTPRFALPELTAEEKAKLGERGGGYEGRLRALYMPGGENTGGFGFGNRGEPDPKVTLDYRFKTELFWIVSRTNNCQYCLGHQESKLLNAGMTEDEIAGLDGDWANFTPAEQAAFAYARKLTLEPHKLSDADIDGLKKHFNEMQILEMTMSMAGNNAINRWKEGVGVPQGASGGGGIGRKSENPAPVPEKHTYVTPTSEPFQTKVTKVAPVLIDAATGTPTKRTVFRRDPLEPRDAVEKQLSAAAARKPRLPLAEEAQARELLGEDAPTGPLPQWVRLLANFPKDGKARILSGLRADSRGDLTPLMKAQASWIIARQDRAWYALGEAKRRLKELGVSEDQVYKLDGDWTEFTPAERALFTVAKKLAATPVVLTDSEVAGAIKLVGPRDVVQMISYTTNRASFDRITEAAGLPIER